MLTSLLLLAATAPPPALQLGLSGGLADSLEGSYSNTGYPLAPVIEARAGVDLAGHLALGALFQAVLGGTGSLSPSPSGVGGAGAFSAIALMPTLRLHSAGETELWLEGGVGVGHLIELQTESSFEHPPLTGKGGVAVRLGAGVRHFTTRTFALGVELAWTQWSNVSQAGGGGFDGKAPARSDLDTSAALLLLGISWAPSR